MAKENNAVNEEKVNEVNNEISKEEQEEIEFKNFLAEIEDFVKNPSKYHTEKEPDFTATFTEEEKKFFEDRYTKAVEMYNKVLPEDKKIKLDVEGLRKRLDDPKQAEMYRRSTYLVDKKQKQQKLYNEYKKQVVIEREGPISRVIENFMRIDPSEEAQNFNKKFIEYYSKHPMEISESVLKGLYGTDLSGYSVLLKDDYERCKYYCDNVENIFIAYDYAHISSGVSENGGLVPELKNVELRVFIQAKLDVASGFRIPKYMFEFPKMTLEQLSICGNASSPGYDYEYSQAAMDLVISSAIEGGRETVEQLNKKGILETNEPLISFKAIEQKDGKEVEIPLQNAIKTDDPNIKIVKRSKDELERMFKLTNGAIRREEIAKIDKSPSTRDSLKVHIDNVKKYIAFASTAKNREENRFDKSYDAKLGLQVINGAIGFLKNKLKDKSNPWFKENREEFLNFAKKCGFKVYKDELDLLDMKEAGNILVDFFGKIEGMLTIEQAVELRKAVKGNGAVEFEKTHEHVLNEKINEIKNNIPENLSKEEKDEYIKALDNINAKVIKKTKDGFIEIMIDEAAKTRKIDAKAELVNIANSMDISEKDKEILLSSDRNSIKTEHYFQLKTPDHYKAFAEVSKKIPPIEFNEAHKNNIKNLCNLVDETGIFNVFTAGESDVKNYGFTSFFDKQTELTELIKKDTSGFTDEQKKEFSKEVIKKSNELNELEANYDKVFDYIKKNFDLNKSSTNENIYSGRPSANGLLEKWDYKNAQYGVILNGLSQLYGTLNDTNATISDLLDNPEKVFKQVLEQKTDALVGRFVLPKEGNSLGKRLARAAKSDRSSFAAVDSTIFAVSRGAEFLFQTDPDKERAMKNMETIAILTKGYEEKHKGASDFLILDPSLNETNPNYNNLITVMMFGDEVKDNIFEPCDDYYNTDYTKTFVPNYMEKYKEMMKNPGEALKHVAEITRDFYKEKVIIDKEVNKMKQTTQTVNFRDEVLPENVAIAGKVILENMLKANNKTIKDIEDPDVRKAIQDYIDNPIKALSNMYKDDLGIKDDKLEAFEEATKKANKDYLNRRESALFKSFSDDMKEIKHTRDDVNMYDEMREHPIGFFEGIFSTKATRLFRALNKAMNGLEEPKSKYFGRVDKVAEAAQAYLDHKFKDGKTIDDLKGAAKGRANFCKNLLNAYKKAFTSETDFVLKDKTTTVKKDLANEKEEKVVDNIIEKEVEVVAEKGPERQTVIGLKDDVNIEKNDKKAQPEKIAKEEKVNEKENNEIDNGEMKK